MMTFNDAEEVVATSLQVLRSIPQEEFVHQLEKLLEHCEHVIASGGDYVTQ